MVPRNRILIGSGDRMRLRFTRLRRAHKLPTRGFSVNHPGLPNLLNSLKLLKLLNPNFHIFLSLIPSRFLCNGGPCEDRTRFMRLKASYPAIRRRGRLIMVGKPGFEPSIYGVKGRCLANFTTPLLFVLERVTGFEPAIS